MIENITTDSRRIKLVIEYSGTGYHGWQIQDNAHTVQAEVEKAIYRITGEKVRITGAGRTDAGVHALGQVAHFDTRSKVPAAKFLDALNAVLPEETAIVHSQEVDSLFHARYSSMGKRYEYRVLNRRARSPLLGNRAWHVQEKLDLDCMNQAAGYFLGRHDFSAFCASGHSVTDYERTVTVSHWLQDGEHLVYIVQGNGFLYHMVRIMVGTLVEIGRGRRKMESIPVLIGRKDRNLAGITAPAHGLYLAEVFY